MEIYDNPTCCDHAPAPAPVEAYEPAPLPTYVPPVPAVPAGEIFPEASAPAAPAAAVAEAPLPQSLPEPVAPLAPAPLTSGTLLGPSVVGGTADLGGSAFVGGTPDLGASTTVGGSWAPDLGGTWIDRDSGTPVAAPGSPVATGPFAAAAANMVNANNAALAGGMLGGDSSSAYPAPWMPGYDSDRDGILNERDRAPRDRFA